MIKTLLAATALTLAPIGDYTVKHAKKDNNADLLIIGLTFSTVIATVVVLNSSEQKPESP